MSKTFSWYHILFIFPGFGIAHCYSKKNALAITSCIGLLLFLLVHLRVVNTRVGLVLFLATLLSVYVFSFAGIFTKNKQNKNSLTLSVIFSVSCCFLIYAGWTYRERILGLNIYFVPSKSMSPTLQPGDLVLVDSWFYLTKPNQKEDIVVFYVPKTRLTFIKRIRKTYENHFDAYGDNPSESIPEKYLKKLPRENIRGKAVIVLGNIKKGKEYRLLKTLN